MLEFTQSDQDQLDQVNKHLFELQEKYFEITDKIMQAHMNGDTNEADLLEGEKYEIIRNQNKVIEVKKKLVKQRDKYVKSKGGNLKLL
jgi:metal-responsive CopG/Arc/MetJ family transcriptional regulator